MTLRYRRKKDPTNTTCCSCDRPIWVRLGTYTMKKKHYHKSNQGEIEAITFMIDIGHDDWLTTNWCPQCVELGELKYETPSEEISSFW